MQERNVTTNIDTPGENNSGSAAAGIKGNPNTDDDDENQDQK